MEKNSTSSSVAEKNSRVHFNSVTILVFCKILEWWPVRHAEISNMWLI